VVDDIIACDVHFYAYYNLRMGERIFIKIQHGSYAIGGYFKSVPFKWDLRFSVVSMKMAVFWVLAPCSLIEVYQCFRGSCCLDDGGSKTSETLVNFYQTTQRYNPEDSHLCTF
jgi:hypothetical protein